MVLRLVVAVVGALLQVLSVHPDPLELRVQSDLKAEHSSKVVKVVDALLQV